MRLSKVYKDDLKVFCGKKWKERKIHFGLCQFYNLTSCLEGKVFFLLWKMKTFKISIGGKSFMSQIDMKNSFITMFDTSRFTSGAKTESKGNKTSRYFFEFIDVE